MPNPASSPPITGPRIPPIRNVEAYMPEIRPRESGGARRTIRPMAEMVNMVEPSPPRPRKSSSCQ